MEILIAMGISAGVLLVIVQFQIDIFNLNELLQVGLKNQNDARKIIKPMANEVRSASQSSIGAFPLETVATSTFTFFTDLDNDGLKERVRYHLDGTTFKKGVIKPSGSPLVYDTDDEEIIRVVEDVLPQTIFTYYDENYDGTASSSPLVQPVTPANVRLVKVEISIDTDPNKPPEPIRVETQMSLRNLKDNL